MARISVLLPLALLLSGVVVACTTETVHVRPGDPAPSADPTGDPAAAEPDESPTTAPPTHDAGAAKDGATGSSGSSGSSSGASGSSGTSSGSSGASGSSSGSSGSSSGASGSGGSSGSSGSSSGSSGSTFTGVGATVATCQGSGTVSVPGVTMHSGFAARMAGQLNVFLYSRPTLSTMAYGGSSGEYKLRLLIGGPTGNPNEYQGQTGVFSWSVPNAKWETFAGGPADIVLVDIADYAVVDPTGLMCNGRLRGVAQWLSGGTAYVISFEVPILTTSFPGANAGPP